MTSEAPEGLQDVEVPREIPSGLSPRAVTLWSSCVSDFDLSDFEQELLAEVVHTMTEIDALREALAADGVTVAGSRGQARVHPAVNEIRQHRMSLARLLKAIDLPSLDDEEPESWTTRNAREAARSRWDLERQRRRG